MSESSKKPETVLVLENDVLARTGLAQYLRHCGYRVIEAAHSAEAEMILQNTDSSVDILFSSIPAFELAQWVRSNRPGIQVVLTGNVEKAARAAGALCEEGPHGKKPYEPEQVVDWIKRATGLL